MTSGFDKDNGEHAVLLHSWIDIKHVFKYVYKGKNNCGMDRMLDILGHEREGRHHSGIDDTKNICKIVMSLLKMDETMFKNYTTCHKVGKKVCPKYARYMEDDMQYLKIM